MNNTAFLFPGQGSQYCGMDKLVPETIKSKKYFSVFKKTFGKKLQQFTEDELKLTQYTQPALFTISASYNSWLVENNQIPTIMAGHSLGEISAMFSAGVFSFEDGLKITKFRGEIMSRVSKKTPGGMCAIVGLSLEKVNLLCQELQKYGVAEPVNINSKNQIVISGEISAMENSIALAKKMGAKLVIPLKVSAPFHSSLMRALSSEFTSFLQNIEFKESNVPIVQNVDAQPHQNPDVLKKNLVSQLYSAVKWTDTLSMLYSKGVKNAIEIGPKKVLTGLCRGFGLECTPIEQLVSQKEQS
ncbi:MAG: ACP S-malonyltransferase [Caldisericia bacterium]|nr:ACP S-malonyltransferase [Caldisericia bacterium]